MKTPFLRMIIAIGVAVEVSVVLGDPNSLKLEISVKAAGENAGTNYAKLYNFVFAKNFGSSKTQFLAISHPCHKKCENT